MEMDVGHAGWERKPNKQESSEVGGGLLHYIVHDILYRPRELTSTSLELEHGTSRYIPTRCGVFRWV